jgi:hypothetical protein
MNKVPQPDTKEPAMISRLTAYAATFAIMSTATIAYATTVASQRAAPQAAAVAASVPLVVHLPRVDIVVAKRSTSVVR